MTWIFSLLACPMDTEFGSLHNLMIQFLKTNLSLSSSLWPIDSVFWRIMTNLLGNPSLIKSLLSVNYLIWKLPYNCHCAFFFFFASWLGTANPMLLQNLLTAYMTAKWEKFMVIELGWHHPVSGGISQVSFLSILDYAILAIWSSCFEIKWVGTGHRKPKSLSKTITVTHIL